VGLYARQETPIRGIYLYKLDAGIPTGVTWVGQRGTACVSPVVRGGILPPRGGRDAHRTPARTATLQRCVYGFATMSNSTRSSFFTFTAPPPTTMGSIPKSFCLICAEP
jgi:hypothetical protein